MDNVQQETVAENTTLEQVTSDTPVVESFIDSLPEHLKGNKNIQKFSSVEALAEGYLNAAKLIGKRIETLPEEAWKGFVDQDALAARLTEQTIPTSVDEIVVPDHLDSVFKDRLKAMAVEKKIPVSAITSLIELEDVVMKEKQEELKQIESTNLITAFGSNLDNVIGSAKETMREFGGDALVDILERHGVLGNVEVLKAFNNVKKQMTPDTVAPLALTKNPGNGSILEVTSEIARLRSDASFMEKVRAKEPQASSVLVGLYDRLRDLETA